MKKIVGLLLLWTWTESTTAQSVNQPLMKALVNADSVTIFSLAPMYSRGALIPADECSANCFHRWHTLGQVTLSGTQATRITKSLIRWIEQRPPEALSACFNPRHGAHVVSDGHAYDFVLCFECGKGEVYRDGEAKPYAYLYTPGQRDIWNRVLDSKKIPREEPDR